MAWESLIKVLNSLDRPNYTLSGIIKLFFQQTTPDLVLFNNSPYIYTWKAIEMNSLRLFLKQKRKELILTQEELALNAGVGLRFAGDLGQKKTTI